MPYPKEHRSGPDLRSQADRLREITGRIEEGVRSVFRSGRYEDYLRTMSRFHTYSFNNTMLIFLQNPSATHVAGYRVWKDRFARQVRAGEHGIRILAPVPFRKETERPAVDPATGEVLVDPDGSVRTERVTVTLPRFRPVTVFDVSQTEGRELPELVMPLYGDIPDYTGFLEAVRRAAGIPVHFVDLEPGTDGFFNRRESSISIRDGMSQVQTICAAVHEIAHARMHADPPENADRRTMEIEAESVAFAVCAYYGIHTEDNSFGYLAAWSAGRDETELRRSLENVSETSASLIEDIDRNYGEILRERGLAAELDAASGKMPEAVRVHFRVRGNLRADSPAREAYLQVFGETEDGTLFPRAVLFHGRTEDCRRAADYLDRGVLHPEDFLQPGADAGEEGMFLLNGDTYLYLSKCGDGLNYDFSVYDRPTGRLRDGGVTDFGGPTPQSEEILPLLAIDLAEYCDLPMHDLRRVPSELHELLVEEEQSRFEHSLAATGSRPSPQRGETASLLERLRKPRETGRAEPAPKKNKQEIEAYGI